MASRTLEITFLGNPKPLQDAMSQVEGSTGKLSGTLKGVGSAFGDVAKIAGGFVVAEGIMKAPGFLMDAAQAAAEDEAATSRLEQALRNAGGAFDENKQKVDERIAAGQELAFGDDAVRDSFQQLLGATGDVDEALRRQALAMDFARGAGIPLEQASKLLGKVTEENVEQFRRLGINIGEGATEADAFAVIQGKYAGQAQVYADSTAGQWEQSKIAMGELKEAIGTALLPVLAKIGEVMVQNVIPAMNQFASWWASNAQPKVQEFITWIGPQLKRIGEFIRDEVMPVVKAQFAKFQDYYTSDIKPALDNVIGAVRGVVTAIKDHWGQIEPFVRPIWIQIQTTAEVAMGLIGVAIDILGGDWKGAVEGMRDIWNDIVGGFTATFDAVKDAVLISVGLLKDGFSGIAGGIKSAFVGAINEIIGLINAAIEAYNKLPLAPNVPTIPTVGGGVQPVYGAPPGTAGYGGSGNYAGGGGGGYGSSSQQQLAVGPTGAYGQGLTWDPAANAWVYPWEVGQFGTGPRTPFGGFDKHNDDAIRLWEQGLGPYPTYTGGREAQTTTVVIQVDGATIAEAVHRHEARAY
jgi:hypothetical protein